MKLGDSEYLKLVEKHMHKLTVLTPEACAQEVKDISEGIFEESAELASEIGIITATTPLVIKKSRGWPKGKKRGPKVKAAGEK